LEGGTAGLAVGGAGLVVCPGVSAPSVTETVTRAQINGNTTRFIGQDPFTRATPALQLRGE
jgi:hypothetical protein